MSMKLGELSLPARMAAAETQHLRRLGRRASTSGSATSPTAYRMLWVRLPRILCAGYPTRQRDQHAIRARGSPLPTGTLTPQETPSFVRRYHLRLKSGRAPSGFAVIGRQVDHNEQRVIDLCNGKKCVNIQACRIYPLKSNLTKGGKF